MRVGGRQVREGCCPGSLVSWLELGRGTGHRLHRDSTVSFRGPEAPGLQHPSPPHPVSKIVSALDSLLYINLFSSPGLGAHGDPNIWRPGVNPGLQEGAVPARSSAPQGPPATCSLGLVPLAVWGAEPPTRICPGTLWGGGV